MACASDTGRATGTKPRLNVNVGILGHIDSGKVEARARHLHRV